MDACVCKAESLRCSREKVTTLSIDYTPIQNEKLFFFLSTKEILCILKYAILYYICEVPFAM